MMHLAAGLFLLCIPYGLVFLFDDRIKGFLYVTVSSIVFDLAAALTTQALHIFSYPIVLSLHILACAGVLAAIAAFLTSKRGRTKGIWPGGFISAFRQDSLFALAAFAVVFFQLYSIHYNYTGIAVTVSGQESVAHSSYPYPIFSDEWITAGLAQYSIESHSLPLANVLQADAPYPNLLAPFNALVAEISLLLGLSPVAAFAVLAVGAGMLLCLVLYACMRSVGIRPVPASIAILCVPYIAESGNLPGIWFLLAYIPGTILFIAMLGGIALKDRILALSAALASVILYAPMAVFVIPALIAGAIQGNMPLNGGASIKGHSVKAHMHRAYAWTGGILILFLIVGAAFFLDAFGFRPIMLAVGRGISHINLDGGVVSYGIWNVVTVPVLILGSVGLFVLSRRRSYWLMAPIGVGLAYWACYAFTISVIIIEYPRIVEIVSLLLIIAAGVGIDAGASWCARHIPKSLPRIKKHLLPAIACCALVVAACLASAYPRYDPWEAFPLHISLIDQEELLMPNPPINRYLQPDDLALFSGISGARFTAPDWKALVIGIATGNYPLESKSATIDRSVLPFAAFENADCSEKGLLAATYSIAYAYAPPFDCPGFSDIGSSSEGLHLYRYR